MIRLLIIALILSLGVKLVFGRWPWEYLRGRTTRQQAVFKARKLLAVQSNASYKDIMEAHKRLIAMVHPDRGGTNEQVHEANAARDLLLDELSQDGLSQE